MRTLIIFITMIVLSEIGGCSLSCQRPEGDYYHVVMRIPIKDKGNTPSKRDQSVEPGISQGAFILVNNSSVPIEVGNFSLDSGMSVNLTDKPAIRKIIGSNDFNKFMIEKGLTVAQHEKTNIWVVRE